MSTVVVNGVLFHADLPKGTVLRHRQGGTRYRMTDDMQGTWAFVRRIRRDDGFDCRQRGWSGSLRVEDYEIEDDHA